MITIVNGIEYLDYKQAAEEYGLKSSSIPPMVSRGVFTSTKFEGIVNKFIDRPQLEAYKNKAKKEEKHQTDKVPAKPNENTIKQESYIPIMLVPKSELQSVFNGVFDGSLIITLTERFNEKQLGGTVNPLV